jgi:signal transduction histidine kinase
VYAVNPLAIAALLGALAVAHATVALYSLVLHGRPVPGPRPRTLAEASDDAAAISPKRRAPSDPAGAPSTSRSATLSLAPRGHAPPPRADRELVVFGLLNLAVVALDGGLARASSLLEAHKDLGPALLIAEGGRIGAMVFLLHFILQYARAPRTAAVIAALYGVGGALEIGNAVGALGQVHLARPETAWILGASVLSVHAPATPLGALAAVVTVAAALVALAVLGRAFLRGRREAAGFIGLTLLTVTVVYDALRNVGWAPGPPIAPFGYAAFVNGVIMTLLSRFTALRGQLEGRARELRDRARMLARSYEELRAAQDNLVRKEQLAAVGELSAVVAHEVRNPLAIISNAVATLRRSGIGDDDRQTLLAILDEETTRLNRLVGDLLRYARPVDLERQQVSLRDLVSRGMTLAEGKPDLIAELIEPDPIEKVWADPTLIRQVIDNLIDNAVQAMSGGGVLTVTLVNLELDGARGVEIQIQDTGEGMDTQVRSRALDPFFTTRPSGTGLGLAIVARIVDAHGGNLRIKSKAGAGTVMHVFLPLAAEPSPRSRRSEPGRTSSDPPLPAELRKAMGRSSKPE